MEGIKGKYAKPVREKIDQPMFQRNLGKKLTDYIAEQKLKGGMVPR